MSSKLLTLLGGGARPFVPLDVPQAEADALIWLYEHTDGDNWTTKTNWLTSRTVGDWYGITVAGGHVTRIELNANGATMNGDIGDFPADDLAALTHLYLYSTSVSGDISGWVLPASMGFLRLYSTSVSGDISGWVLPASIQDLFIDTTSLSGDISGWVLPAMLADIRLYSTSLTGDISGWVIPAATRYVYLLGRPFTGVPSFASAAALINLGIYNMSLSQTDVDGWLAAIYARRAAFTYATPQINIGGDGGTINAAPSGMYQDGDPPTTGKEYIYELANDPESEGFKTWSIVYNGGSAP